MRVGLASRALKHSFCDSRLPAERFAGFLRALGIAIACSCCSVSWADDSVISAREFIEALGHRAQSTLRTDSLNSDQKVASIQRLLQESVDLKGTGRRVLGHSWKTATAVQRKEYDELFEKYVLKIYPKALLQHRSQEFVVTEAKGSVGRDTLVFSRIEGSAGQSVRWAWRVREENGDHKITDLLADGISMTSTLRDEFKSHVFHHGLDGLLEKLRSIE